MRKEIDVGTDVICDFCGSDGDASSGGVMIGSNAVCGLCCESNGYYDPNYIYKDEIGERFSKENTFKENVLNYRYKNTGSKNGKIIIESM